MNNKLSTASYGLLALTALLVACGIELEDHGTTNQMSSGVAASSSTTSSSSAGGETSSASSSGNGGTGGNGGGVSSSSGCPQCMVGAPGACVPGPIGLDDCPVSGELCSGAGFCECGVSQTPTVTMCPPGWDGSINGVCVLHCNTASACKNLGTILCPVGRDCVVECSGTNSCTGNTVIQCAPGASCEVDCSNAGSCNALAIKCSDDGPCAVNCSGDSTACTSTKVECGNNACAATCNGPSEKPVLSQRAGTQSCNVQSCP